MTDQAPGARFPLAALSGTATRGAAIVPAVTNAAAAHLIGAAPAQLSLDSTQTLTIRVGRPDRRCPRHRCRRRRGAAPAGPRVTRTGRP